jgi:hypothetical protein
VALEDVHDVHVTLVEAGEGLEPVEREELLDLSRGKCACLRCE